MTNPDLFTPYILVTPARNEAAFIRHTLDSVAAQTVRPVRWVVVDDGSTDATAAIVEEHVRRHPFIRLVRLERAGARSFGRKAMAFRRGLEAVGDIDYAFVGNLDADISLPPDYYEQVLRAFTADPALGIAGGIVYTKTGRTFSTVDGTLDSVAGAVQLFRRRCFEETGGYPSLMYGGIDAAAEIRARMVGWRVRKDPSLRVFEHRRTGSAGTGVLRARLLEGRRFHSLGYGPAFYAARCLYRLTDRPFVIGSLTALCGFVESMLRRRPILLPPEVVAFLRHEQRNRLRRVAAVRGTRYAQ
jgi:poly-beta-1,6-N-acetyl-D-glucosamine synthase